MKWLVYIIISFASLTAVAQETKVQRSQWLIDEIFRLETRVEATRADIEKIQTEIQKCDVTISKSERIIGLAQQKGNAEAEKIASEAFQKAQDAKQKNSANLIAMNGYLIKLMGILEYVKTGADDAAIKSEQFDFENKKDEWLKAKDELIRQRIKEPNLFCNSLYTSLKTNAPPPLPGKKFDELQPGDVLLISKDTSMWSISNWINRGDNFISSTKESDASHTLIFLKEINGKKMFLDNVPGKGPTIISEQEYLYLYGKRHSKVAELAQPLDNTEGEKLYQAARQLAGEQLKKNTQKFLNIITDTKYGVIGTDMVCSEASRWALMNTGREIPASDDMVKNMIGIEYSPADFCKSKYFIITPLYGEPEAGNKK